MLNRSVTLITLLAAFVLTTGCKTERIVNPSFAVSVKDAKAVTKQMRDEPTPLERPVIVLGGWFDFGPGASYFARQVERLTGDERVHSATFFFTADFDAARDSVIRDVTQRFPDPDRPGEAVEVDVVGISMGGLVARHAAIPDEQGRRLRINRLFTIATPHRGAEMARLPVPDGFVPAMRAGSDFLAQLDDALDDEDYPIYAYVRLDDGVIGPANASPPGRPPWWVDDELFQNGHISAHHDPRIIADIVRRLRGEPPYATEPPAPLPTGEQTEDAPAPASVRAR